MILESPNDRDRIGAVVSKASNVLAGGQDMFIVVGSEAARDYLVKAIVKSLLGRRVEVQANMSIITTTSGVGESKGFVATLADAAELARQIEKPTKTVVETDAAQALVGEWLAELPTAGESS